MIGTSEKCIKSVQAFKASDKASNAPAQERLSTPTEIREKTVDPRRSNSDPGQTLRVIKVFQDNQDMPKSLNVTFLEWNRSRRRRKTSNWGLHLKTTPIE